MDEIYDFISNSKHPISINNIIIKYEGIFTETKIKISLSNLITNKKIETFTEKNEIFFKKSEEQNEKEILLILLLLKENKNGLTARQIRMKLNLSVNLITKILKKMEIKDQIKSYKGIKGNVKIYSLFETERDDIGIFFNDGDVDEELVDNMIKIIMQLFNKTENNLKGILSIEEIYKFINNSKIFETNIQKQDIEKLLKIMSYDNLIIEVNTGIELLYLSK